MKLRSLAACGALAAASFVGLAAHNAGTAKADTMWPPDASYDCYYNRPDASMQGYSYWSFEVVGDPQNSANAYCRYTYVSDGDPGGAPAGVPAYPTKAIDWDYACRATYEDTATSWWFAGDNNMYCNR